MWIHSSLPNTVFLVAEENNKILGYIGMYLSIDEGEIHKRAVSPEMRCHGIGGMLLGGSKKRGRERSVGESCSKSMVSNDSAIRLASAQWL